MALRTLYLTHQSVNRKPGPRGPHAPIRRCLRAGSIIHHALLATLLPTRVRRFPHHRPIGIYLPRILVRHNTFSKIHPFTRSDHEGWRRYDLGDYEDDDHIVQSPSSPREEEYPKAKSRDRYFSRPRSANRTDSCLYVPRNCASGVRYSICHEANVARETYSDGEKGFPGREWMRCTEEEASLANREVPGYSPEAQYMEYEGLEAVVSVQMVDEDLPDNDEEDEAGCDADDEMSITITSATTSPRSGICQRWYIQHLGDEYLSVNDVDEDEAGYDADDEMSTHPSPWQIKLGYRYLSCTRTTQ